MKIKYPIYFIFAKQSLNLNHNNNLKNNMVNSYVGILQLIFMIYCCFKLCLSVMELMFVSVRDELFHNQCIFIWNWFVAILIIDFVNSFIGICYIKHQCKDDYSYNNSGTLIKYLQIAHIGSFIVSTWATVTYLNISNYCYQFLVSSTPEFWIFIQIHFWLLIIVLIFILCNCVFWLLLSLTRKMYNIEGQ